MSVALAGGTGGLGRAIADAINARGKSNVVVLTRKKTPGLEEKLGAQVAAVNYSDVASLASVLEEYNVHTVISAVNNITGDNAPELNLIRAAEKAKTTNRFIPSYFGVPYLPEQCEVFAPAMAKQEALVELQSTSLEWTTVYNGYFLDYFGTPKVKSYVDDVAFFIDLGNNTAAIPGSGNVPVVFTHTFDIAKFVAAALELPKWQRESYIIGDRLTWNELVQLAEEVKGTKFIITHDPVETLQAGKVTELPSHRGVYDLYAKEHLQGFLAVFGLMCERGQANLKPGHSLNQEFPEIKPRSARDVIEQGWGKY